jgi:tetratricopeptide (TPR) repeat protein
MNYSQIASRLERYPASPLFARLASEYLDSGRVSDARALCTAGLLEYPEYSTGHLILAECHAAENRYRDAVESLRRALDLNPDSLLFSGLLDEWQELLDAAGEYAEPTAAESEIASEETEAESTIESVAAPSEAIPTQPEPIQPADDWVQVALESAATPPGETTPEIADAPPAISAPPVRAEAPPPEPVTIPPLRSAAVPTLIAQDQEGDAATVTITPSLGGGEEFSDAGRIVSKTLAEIYVTQGAFDEAILTYRLLKRTRPELVPQIEARIIELEGLSRGR